MKLSHTRLTKIFSIHCLNNKSYFPISYRSDNAIIIGNDIEVDQKLHFLLSHCKAVPSPWREYNYSNNGALTISLYCCPVKFVSLF